MVNLIELSQMIPTKAAAIVFLQQRALLHDQRNCSQGHSMTLSFHPDRWRCHRSGCRESVGLRKGTWFEGSRLEFRTVMLFIYCWSKGYAGIENIPSKNYTHMTVNHTKILLIQKLVCTRKILKIYGCVPKVAIKSKMVLIVI